MKNFEINEQKDFLSNFDKLFDSIKRYKKWDLDESKWICIFGFMTLQSLFILNLKFTNTQILEKWECNKKGYRFILDYNSETNFDKYISKIDNKNIYINEWKFFNLNLIDVKNEFDENWIILSNSDFKSIYNQIHEIISFNSMFKKVSDKNLMDFLSKNYLNIEKYNSTIKFLIKIRNDFIHYMPKSWTIKLNWFDKIINDILEIINHLLDKNEINKSEINKKIDILIKVNNL